MEIRELSDESERRRAVPLLGQLWTDRTSSEILDWTGAEDYHLFGGTLGGELIAVAGVVLARHLHHTSHAWLYDLVVEQSRRGTGHGTAMVEYVETWARERDCESIALASPLRKKRTHQFYESRGYEKWGYVIEKEL